MSTPVFDKVVVDADPKDGYWVQAVDVDGDGRMDLIASGLATGNIVWYRNGGTSWTRHHIARLDKPVALDSADIAGAGRADLVVCHDYGECMFGCRPQDGKISWLRNPGAEAAIAGKEWERRPVGDLVATHRLRLGQYTRSRGLQLAALPVVGPQGGATGVNSPAHLVLYDRPDNVLDAKPWPSTTMDNSRFRVVHGVVADRFAGTPEPERDSMLLASAEGLSWLGPDGNGGWQSHLIGTGAPLQQQMADTAEHRFRGSGNLAIGRIGGDPYAYIAALEPFHGNIVSAYTRPAGGTPFSAEWKRTELEVHNNPDKPGTAVGHHVVAADFDGDGDDEFLVAMRGPAPAQGVFYYKIDAEGRQVARHQVATESAARIAVADFTGDGRLDFATTGYYTPGYYKTPNPAVTVYVNRFGRRQIPHGANG